MDSWNKEKMDFWESKEGPVCLYRIQGYLWYWSVFHCVNDLKVDFNERSVPNVVGPFPRIGDISAWTQS
jgi:hypothetical protein